MNLKDYELKFYDKNALEDNSKFISNSINNIRNGSVDVNYIKSSIKDIVRNKEESIKYLDLMLRILTYSNGKDSFESTKIFHDYLVEGYGVDFSEGYRLVDLIDKKIKEIVGFMSKTDLNHYTLAKIINEQSEEDFNKFLNNFRESMGGVFDYFDLFMGIKDEEVGLTEKMLEIVLSSTYSGGIVLINNNKSGLIENNSLRDNKQVKGTSAYIGISKLDVNGQVNFLNVLSGVMEVERDNKLKDIDDINIAKANLLINFIESKIEREKIKVPSDDLLYVASLVVNYFPDGYLPKEISELNLNKVAEPELKPVRPKEERWSITGDKTFVNNKSSKKVGTFFDKLF